VIPAGSWFRASCVSWKKERKRLSLMANRVSSSVRQTVLAAVAVGLFMPIPSAWAQTGNECDLNHDGSVNNVDVQLAMNMALGLTPCTANIYGPGVCNIIVVQRVTNAALGGACLTGTGTPSHSVALSWTASISSNVAGYYVYRGATLGGPYTKLNSSPVAGTVYTDYTVQSGQTYYYVATSVDGTGSESAYSEAAKAVVPFP